MKSILLSILYKRKLPGLDADGLKIKQRVQRGMTILILTLSSISAAKTLIFCL